jgi:dihydrofolate reductase
MKHIIVAYDAERGIGRDNELLWGAGEMKSDMARFRQLTTGQTVIMGRKTLESIGRALPRRENIVVTRQAGVDIPGVQVAHSLDEAYGMARAEQTYVIGGADIYRQALADVERVYATEVAASLSADTKFPSLSRSEWELLVEDSYPSDDNNKYDYTFKTYERI